MYIYGEREIQAAEERKQRLERLTDFLENGPQQVQMLYKTRLRNIITEARHGNLMEGKSEVEIERIARTLMYRKRGAFKRFQLADTESERISCIIWDGEYYITGTDIIKIIVYRLGLEGIIVAKEILKKFEEGVFSDLRYLKPGAGARLEEARSEFLAWLCKHGCIRTQKKQKVYFWDRVDFEKLIKDAKERFQKKPEFKNIITPPTLDQLFPNASSTIDPFLPTLTDMTPSFDTNNLDNDPLFFGGDTQVNFFTEPSTDHLLMDLNDDNNFNNINNKDMGINLGELEDHLNSSSGSLTPPEDEMTNYQTMITSFENNQMEMEKEMEKRQTRPFDQNEEFPLFESNNLKDQQQQSSTNNSNEMNLNQALEMLQSYTAPTIASTMMNPSSTIPMSMSILSINPSQHSLFDNQATPRRSTNTTSNGGLIPILPAGPLPNTQSTFLNQGRPISQAYSSPSSSSNATTLFRQYQRKDDERRFACTYKFCSRRFKRLEHLKRHLRIHTGERPFTCPVVDCSKSFSRSDNLAQHLKVHMSYELAAVTTDTIGMFAKISSSSSSKADSTSFTMNGGGEGGDSSSGTNSTSSLLTMPISQTLLTTKDDEDDSMQLQLYPNTNHNVLL